jgi:hypothetical protein
VSTFLLLTCIAAPQPPSVVKAEPDAKLTAAFRQTDGWVGGDGAFSVRLSDTRAVWLFSDSWVGRIRDGKRKDVAMVNNAVGVQDGTGPDAKFTFFTQTNAKGKPAAFFVPPDGKGWFWLFAGHAAGGKLHVFLPRFEKAEGAPGFGFKAVDLWLGTVSNPEQEPTKWKIEYAKVPFASFDGKRKFAFGSAALTAGNDTYVYGYEEVPGKPFASRKLLVARAPKDKLADFDAWRFYANGEWKPDVKDATSQAGALGAEFSVSYVSGLKQYAMVTTENGLSDRIVGRFAPSPTGPWTDPVLLYTCPEMKKDKKLFTYAGKAHPHLAGDNELVISYAVNSGDLGQVINDAELSWPNFVRVQLK